MQISRFFNATVVVFLLGQLASAQPTTGDILGTVRDPSGSVVTGAKVSVRNLDTNQSQETRSSETGTFRVPLLPVGSYEVTVEKPGFARYRQRPIVLN